MLRARPRSLARVLLLLVFVASFLLGLAGLALAQGQQSHTALVADVDGIINPISQRYITRTVEKGEDEQAEVVIILLNTPGGLLSSTRKISESLLNATVPTVVFVSPRGAQAASAGTFITAAAHVAVMAPSTSIGAATPVGSGGEDLPETLSDKATNAAAADMRAIATERGRNVEELESTVISAKSFSSEEAVNLNVVDFIAEDFNDLLLKLDGRTVAVGEETRTLSTRNVQVERLDMGLINRVLFILADPNISFILLTLGGLGLVVEIWSPGLVIPGLTGVVFLVVAFISLGNLPVNWGGCSPDPRRLGAHCPGDIRGRLRRVGHRRDHKLHPWKFAIVRAFRHAIANGAFSRHQPLGIMANRSCHRHRSRLGADDHCSSAQDGERT